MTHRSKRKGSGFELEVVRRLQNRGLAAEKMPLT
jgi:Holliday junction resolvase